ncbi:ABC transporter permease [Leucobacter ruminantium]|uniref:ABC transporter permease n=1 Tax=Leucobacter ruminantium TaxID=1289170 RepID=A0A939LUQ5_9MICO|nr:ABC transporter permease [Leucobacter ruminantium]MBO1804747.1 ABC transporter permease [Leucobacter ruminantium]
MTRTGRTGRAKDPGSSKRLLAPRDLSALLALSAMSGRDMLRHRLTGFAALFMFAWMIALYVVMSLMTGGWSLTDEASQARDPLRSALPGVLLTGIAAIAFMGTTVPIVAMRERGMLRLLGTTPLRRPVFLAAQLPVRLILVAVETAVAVGIAELRGFTEDLDPLRLAVTLVLGTAMCFAFAFLFAARASSSEAAHHATTFLCVALLFASGGIVPIATLPDPLLTAAHTLPPVWFATALGADLTGAASPLLPLPLLWLMMAVTTGAIGIAATRRFRWDQTEHTPAPAPARTEPRP